MTAAEWVLWVEFLLEGPDPGAPPPDSFLNAIHGQTTAGARRFLNALCADGMDYLEIGTYRGASLLAAAYGNTGRFTGIDDFSMFPEGGNCRIELLANLEKYAGPNVRFIESSEEAVVSEILDNSVDVFFYDGDHGDGTTAAAILRYIPKMKSPGVLVVDDYDWGPPREGVGRALDTLPSMGWRVVEQWAVAAHTTAVDPHFGVFIGVLERL